MAINGLDPARMMAILSGNGGSLSSLPVDNSVTYQPNGTGAGSGAGAFDWIAQLINGGINLGTAQSDVGFGREAAGLADPFSTERSHYKPILEQYMGANAVNPTAATARTSSAYDMLQGLLKDPSSLSTMPGYQWGLNQALEGVNRAAGSSGLLNSGNRLMALQDRGQSYAQGWQKQIFDQLLGNVGAAGNVDTLGLNAQNQGYRQLADLSGVTSGSPAEAARAFERGLQGRSNAIGAGAGGLAAGAGGLLNGGLSMIQRLLSGGGGGLNLGGIDPGDVYGPGSGWGDDLIQGGLGGSNGGWDDIIAQLGGSNGDWDMLPGIIGGP